MQTKALKCGSTEFKHQIPTSPMYNMSQLIGGRKKKQKTKKRKQRGARWAELFQEENKQDSLPCGAVSTNFPQSHQQGRWSAWDTGNHHHSNGYLGLICRRGAEKREAIMPGEACKNIVSLFLPATAGHRCLPSKYPQPISRSQIYSKGQRRFPRIHQKLPRKGQYLPITQNAGSQDARACSQSHPGKVSPESGRGSPATPPSKFSFHSMKAEFHTEKVSAAKEEISTTSPIRC